MEILEEIITNYDTIMYDTIKENYSLRVLMIEEH